jgi:hypothetical protein
MSFKEFIEEKDELNEGGRYSLGKYTRAVGKLNRASQKVLDAMEAHDTALMDWQEDADESYPDKSMSKYSSALKDARAYFQMSEEYTRK